MRKRDGEQKGKSARTSKGVYTVPAVKKAFMILELMASHNCGYTITEVAKLFNLPVSTTNVLLHSLQECGYVQRSGKGVFSLTMKLFAEGNKIVNEVELHRLALPELERLATLTDLTVSVAIPDKYELMYLSVFQGRGDILVQARVGQRRHFHQAATGKAMLAFFPEERVKEYAEVTGLPAATPKTISSYRLLTKELELFRVQGYAIDNEESGHGLWGIAAPIFDRNGKVAGALGLAGTTLHLQKDMESLNEEVKESAREVSRCLGYKAEVVTRLAVRS